MFYIDFLSYNMRFESTYLAFPSSINTERDANFYM